MPGIFYILRYLKNSGLFIIGLMYFKGDKAVIKNSIILLLFNGIVATASLMIQEII